MSVTVCAFPFKWEENIKGTSLSKSAFHPDTSTVSSYNLPDQCKAQSGAASCAAGRVIDPEEPVEYPVKGVP